MFEAQSELVRMRKEGREVIQRRREVQDRERQFTELRARVSRPSHLSDSGAYCTVYGTCQKTSGFHLREAGGHSPPPPR